MQPLASFLSAALLVSATLEAQVLRVPSQYPSIGAALSAATSGSRILVAGGIYAENLVWPGVDGIRLIGEAGAAGTVIDGGAIGTVIAFGSGLSRQTVVEGFTIMNGLLQTANNRNYGAGISISNSAPTIRNNRITGNAGDGTSWNYGGGCYITGANANPLIAGNEIDNNELRNGSWNYGAGIYVGSGAQAEIVGNRIHDNRNLTVNSTSTGRGHGAGVYVAGTALVASNLISSNTNNTSGWNYGGGIVVYSPGNASVYNNTIANNTVTGGLYRSGGGVYVDGGATATLRGNIVVGNTGEGVFRSSSTTGALSCDFDLVWNNTAANYANTAAGPNSISVDPRFVGATDFHLASGSPCIDAIALAYLPAAVAEDMDSDPRRIDGDLDGGSTNGARLDIGADEFTAVRLQLGGTPQLGGSITYGVTAAQPSLYLFAIALQTGNFLVEPYGNLLLAGSIFVPAVGVTPATLPVSIPNTPALRGLAVHAQALVSPLPPGASGQFSNLASVTVY